MKITVKTIQQESIVVEIDPDQTISNLKQLIYEKKGEDFSVERQQIIFGGEVLEDNRRINSYDIDETKTLVIMLKRNLATADERQKDEETRQTNASKQAEEEKKKKNEDDDDDKQTSPGQSSMGGLSRDHPSLEVIGQRQNEDLIRLLMEMGYTRETVEEALAVNGNNPLQTVEYLIGDLSSNQSGSVGLPDSSLDNMAGSLYDVDSQDSEVLNELSQQDREAIERLCNLGFPIHEVVQVYYACGKDEELAANLLLSGMDSLDGGEEH